MKTLGDAIMEHAERLPEDALIRAGDLLHLGSRIAVNRALARLVKRDRLLRVYRGIYVRVFTSEFGSKYTASTHRVVRNIARASGETIVINPAAVANGLGLSKHVPMRDSYLTTGRSRQFRFRALIVKMRHESGWRIAIGTRKSADALRAVDWVGEEFAADALRKLKDRLSKEELQEMVDARPKLPPWLADKVGEVVA